MAPLCLFDSGSLSKRKQQACGGAHDQLRASGTRNGGRELSSVRGMFPCRLDLEGLVGFQQEGKGHEEAGTEHNPGSGNCMRKVDYAMYLGSSGECGVILLWSQRCVVEERAGEVR